MIIKHKIKYKRNNAASTDKIKFSVFFFNFDSPLFLIPISTINFAWYENLIVHSFSIHLTNIYQRPGFVNECTVTSMGPTLTLEEIVFRIFQFCFPTQGLRPHIQPQSQTQGSRAGHGSTSVLWQPPATEGSWGLEMWLV